jgi:hypothetical protein
VTGSAAHIQYLNTYAAHRAQQNPGFEEFLREPVAGPPTQYRTS